MANNDDGPAAPRTALLTVGSTSFPSLIATALALPTLAALRDQGFDELLVQHGRSALPEGWSTGSPSPPKDLPAGLRVELFAFRDGIEDLYPGVDLVISHAGAGSILTSLRAAKPLIAVVNGSFADNHQAELADALGARGHLLVATPATLAKTISSLAAAQRALTPFPPADPRAFLRIVEEEAGFA